MQKERIIELQKIKWNYAVFMYQKKLIAIDNMLKLIGFERQSSQILTFL
jgi:hypothetical protein